MKVLSLDVSTITGYAFGIMDDSGVTLKDFGTIPKVTKPAGDYPKNYYEWAHKNFIAVLEMIEKYEPDHLVIESTSKGSKNALSQQILEWSHFLIAGWIIQNKMPVTYFQTGAWRVLVGAKMTAD